MPVTNTQEDVLYVQVATSMQLLSALIGELELFLDEESHRILNLLFNENLLNKFARAASEIRHAELEYDMSPDQVSEIIEQEKLVVASASLCVDFLYALRGEKNEVTRRAFFGGGVTLLSIEPLSVDGKMRYLAIGQDACSKREDKQRLFSIRLIPALEMIPHKLYRVLAAKL